MANKKRVLMQGNEACVEGAIAAGMRFYAGYPITPSTEIAEMSALKLPKVGGKFIQMEDEISGMAAVIGASAVGVKAMTATSGPGFSLKQENIGYAAIAELPCVIVDVQRSGPSTGLPTSPSQADVMQARWGTHGDHPIIAISPSSVEETYRLAIRCFNLAEKYMTPVIFLMDEIVGHMREGIELPDLSEIEVIDRRRPDPDDDDYKPYFVKEGEYVPVLSPFGEGKRYNITGLVHGESGFPSTKAEVAGPQCERLMKKIECNKDDIIEYEEKFLDDADIAIVCYGGTTRSVMRAITKAREKGVKVGMFRPITIWPFADEAVEKLAKKVKKIIVVEHNYGQLVYEVERAAKGACGVEHMGCVNGKVIMPDDVLKKIEEVRI